LIFFGIAIMAIGFSVIASAKDYAPIIPHIDEVMIITFGCLLNGIGTSLAHVIAGTYMKEYAISISNNSVTGIMSGLSSFCALFGAFCGPLSSPYLVKWFSFEKACVGTALVLAISGMIILIGIRPGKKSDEYLELATV
jgi:MFS family permease